MNTRVKRWWRELRSRQNRLWVTQVVASVVAVLLALAGAWGAYWVIEGTFPDIERSTLDDLLTVIATSMLAVTTFSLSIMVGAFSAAAANATPRATPLLMADDGTRTAIAAFLSAFIYAVVAKIALGMGYYGSNGRFILFLGTLAVLAWLLVTLVRWVRTLSSLGSLANTLSKVEQTSLEVLKAYWRDPFLGAARGAPQGLSEYPGQPVLSRRTGHVTHIDMASLHASAEDAGREVHVRVRPGAVVWPGAVVAWIGPLGQGAPDMAEARDVLSAEALSDAVRDALTIGEARSFDQDPRFGLIVLGEIGQRALSAAVNDPGTAIDVMSRLVRILIEAQQVEPSAEQQPSIRYDRISLVPLDEAALVHDAFEPLSRDGAGQIEVGIRMQKLLAMLAAASRSPVVTEAACRQAEHAYRRGLSALALEHERAALEASARQ